MSTAKRFLCPDCGALRDKPCREYGQIVPVHQGRINAAKSVEANSFTKPKQAPNAKPPTNVVCPKCGAAKNVKCPGGKSHPERIRAAAGGIFQ